VSLEPGESPNTSTVHWAIVDKRRPRPNVSEVMNIIGDVSGKPAVIVDDLVDTAGTLCQAADALIEAGATEVRACCTPWSLVGARD